MNIEVICPFCLKTTTYNDTKLYGFCMRCGQKISFSSKPAANLIISFINTFPEKEICFLVTILSTGKTYSCGSGQSLEFYLAPGIQAIDIRIGYRTYRRNVFIDTNNRPIQMLASWGLNRRGYGIAQITINDPNK